VARYVYKPIDTSSDEARTETYKPFHHLYNAAGDALLTKGPGGLYTHHRGVFYGFSKTRYTGADGKRHEVDTWHCKGDAHQSHQSVIEQTGDADRATQRVAIDWHGEGGEVIAHEVRQLDFSFAGGDLVVDFTSTLTPAVPELALDGDPQHAGFHFRASDEVAQDTKGQTYYIRPGDGRGEPGETRNWPDDQSQKDLPWKAMSFVTGGERSTVLYLDHPENPKPAMHSERDYGRFGSYFVATLTPDKPLTVRYRLVVRPGEMTPEEAEALAKDFTGA
jgi:hypothetical protein